MPVPEAHAASGAPSRGRSPRPALFAPALWGAERKFWQQPVYTTAVGLPAGSRT